MTTFYAINFFTGIMFCMVGLSAKQKDRKDMAGCGTFCLGFLILMIGFQQNN